jgi:hypothetical protein
MEGATLVPLYGIIGAQGKTSDKKINASPCLTLASLITCRDAVAHLKSHIHLEDGDTLEQIPSVLVTAHPSWKHVHTLVSHGMVVCTSPEGCELDVIEDPETEGLDKLVFPKTGAWTPDNTIHLQLNERYLLKKGQPFRVSSGIVQTVGAHILKKGNRQKQVWHSCLVENPGLVSPNTYKSQSWNLGVNLLPPKSDGELVAVAGTDADWLLPSSSTTSSKVSGGKKRAAVEVTKTLDELKEEYEALDKRMFSHQIYNAFTEGTVTAEALTKALASVDRDAFEDMSKRVTAVLQTVKSIPEGSLNGNHKKVRDSVLKKATELTKEGACFELQNKQKFVAGLEESLENLKLNIGARASKSDANNEAVASRKRQERVKDIEIPEEVTFETGADVEDRTTIFSSFATHQQMFLKMRQLKDSAFADDQEKKDAFQKLWSQYGKAMGNCKAYLQLNDKDHDKISYSMAELNAYAKAFTNIENELAGDTSGKKKKAETTRRKRCRDTSYGKGCGQLASLERHDQCGKCVRDNMREIVCLMEDNESKWHATADKQEYSSYMSQAEELAEKNKRKPRDEWISGYYDLIEKAYAIFIQHVDVAVERDKDDGDEVDDCNKVESEPHSDEDDSSMQDFIAESEDEEEEEDEDDDDDDDVPAKKSKKNEDDLAADIINEYNRTGLVDKLKEMCRYYKENEHLILRGEIQKSKKINKVYGIDVTINASGKNLTTEYPERFDTEEKASAKIRDLESINKRANYSMTIVELK